MQVAERLLEAFSAFVPYNDQQLKIGASIGIAIHDPRHESNIDQAIRRADQSLYQAKREGKNRVVVYSSPE